MRTSLDIPEFLVEEAKKATGSKTMTQVITLALTELIQRRRSRRLLELKGSLVKMAARKVKPRRKT